jgi:Ni/Fe-hydrogenase subunit HybB-like protein
MCEIWLLTVLGRQLADRARTKGHSPGGYVTMMVLLWIGFEIGGFIFGMVVSHRINPNRFDNDAFFPIAYGFALAGAAAAVGISFGIVTILPDYGTPRSPRRFDRTVDRYDDRPTPDDRRAGWDKDDQWRMSDKWDKDEKW